MKKLDIIRVLFHPTLVSVVCMFEGLNQRTTFLSMSFKSLKKY